MRFLSAVRGMREGNADKVMSVFASEGVLTKVTARVMVRLVIAGTVGVLSKVVAGLQD